MKILVLSLLRSGDLIMQKPLFEQIRKRHRNCEMHLVINEEMLPFASSLIPDVKIWPFPRKVLQNLLVEAHYSQARAFALFSAWVKELNSQQFDRIYNFTHNELSARLMDLLKTSDPVGVRYLGGKPAKIENRWLAQLNDDWPLASRPQFHYADILAKSMNLDFPVPKNTASGPVARIAIQCFTSDSKKNWNLESYNKLIAYLLANKPSLDIKLLCAPEDRVQLEQAIDPFAQVNIDETSLQAMPPLLESIDLLITSDTSVQHLAASLGVRTLSIFLGSANPYKTAPYQNRSIVLASKQSCYPCVHSSPCQMASHLCAEDIKPEYVCSLVMAIINDAELPRSTGTQIYVSSRILPGSQLLEKQDPTLFESVTWKLQHLVWQNFLDQVKDTKKAANALHLSLANNSQDASEFLEHLMKQSRIELRMVQKCHGLDELLACKSAMHSDYWGRLERHLRRQRFTEWDSLKPLVDEIISLLQIEIKIVEDFLQGGQDVQRAREPFEVGFAAAREIGAADL